MHNDVHMRIFILGTIDGHLPENRLPNERLFLGS